MLTNCVAACVHLSITVSEIQRDICEKIGNFSYPLVSDAPFKGFRQNIGTPFGMGKLVWCRYPMVKKFRRYLYSFWRNSRTWRTDGRTDGQTPGDSIYRAYAYASRGKNLARSSLFPKPASTMARSCKTPGVLLLLNLLNSWLICYQQACA